MTPAPLDLRDGASVLAGIRAGQTRAAARLMRWIDDRDPRADALLRALYPTTGAAHIIGLTGNPGAGKSTLSAALVAAWRKEGRKVGVIAVDPSSPFSGGALLGDRIRMVEHTLDDGVFIRSVATRGHMGGLSRSTHDLAVVLDAMGYDPILIETVGVGQDEVDVVKVAHTTAVVVVPGLGDDIQAIKAGLLEIADIFVINKADREGSDRTLKDLRMMQTLGAHPAPSAWHVPLIRTVAISRSGIGDLIAAFDAHRQWDTGAGAAQRTRDRVEHLVRSLVHDHVAQALDAALVGEDGAALVDALLRHERDPWTEARRLLGRLPLGRP